MRDRSEPRRHPFNSITMGHPHDGRIVFTDVLEEIALVVDGEIGPPVLPVLGFYHLPAGEMGHQLHAVADAENRNALIEEFLGDARRLLIVHAGWAAGEHDTLWAVSQNRGQRRRARQNLRIDLRFADTAGDQLGVLRPEVENQNSIVPEFHTSKRAYS